jgi:hypothetical protein
LRPDLIKEWDKCNEKTAFDYKPQSGQSVWWICSVCGHHWKAAISDRFAGHGCIKCARRKSAQQRSMSLRKKVYQYSLSGELLQEYDSAAVASVATGISKSAIKNACNPNIKLQPAGGYKWSYNKSE